jgi:hypothetical protein
LRETRLPGLHLRVTLFIGRALGRTLRRSGTLVSFPALQL